MRTLTLERQSYLVASIDGQVTDHLLLELLRVDLSTRSKCEVLLEALREHRRTHTSTDLGFADATAVSLKADTAELTHVTLEESYQIPCSLLIQIVESWLQGMGAAEAWHAVFQIPEST